MGIKTYFKRMIRYVFKGEPRKEVFVRISAVNYGEILKDKHILITGGSTGIGLAIAKKCVEEGAKVLITGRDIKKLEIAQKEIGIEKCKILRFDISEINKFDSNIKRAIELLDNKVDILINNAGIGWWKNYWDYTYNDFEKMLQTNLTGAYFLSQKISHYWVENNYKGNILMISSEAGIIGDFAPYGLSKCALNHLTKGLAKKLIEYGIRVNAVAPGVTATSISEDNSRYNPTGNLYREKTRGKRVLLVEEIAEVAIFLLSDASKCINGEVIVCDEGNALT